MPPVETWAIPTATAVLPPLIEAMTRPEFYPHRPASVELRQTHISYVLLAGEYAYKIKKPVRFAFIDSSTLAKRFHLCEEEVRLNRRLASSVYLGVVLIIRTGAGFALADDSPDGRRFAEECAVKMRRLPAERMFDRMVREGAVNNEIIRAVARRLVDFHRGASTAKSWVYGSAEAVWRMVLSNLEETERFAGYTVAESDLAAVERYGRNFIASNWELLNRRAREGRVCEGHGDLRCESICLTDEIVIFDCLEFSERLRYGDAAAEIAFLAMDLDRLGASALSRELVTAYSAAADDPGLAMLVPFYKCCRAIVRAKVESLRSLACEVPEGEREEARQLARCHFNLALRYAAARAPVAIAVCGLSGTGKSTIARMLGERTGFEILSSDKIRKRLAQMPDSSHSNAGYGAGIYSESFNRLTYDTLVKEGENRLRSGAGVILDATFRRPEDRRLLLEAAARNRVPALFVECRAPETEVLRRLGERKHRADEPSDATAEVYLRQRSEFTPPDEIPSDSHLVVDTTRPPEQLAIEVERALERLSSRLQSGRNRLSVPTALECRAPKASA